MSYQVLARKWRPKSFEQLVGQSQTAKALINALDSQRLHHAYLFTGTRGVGKTTIARILSKSLNCEKGITSSPCGICSSCLEIDQGNFVDLMEIDAASKTKVEDTRELLDNVQYRPTRGRYKVYLIDEVHMLSGHSFNALLKTLEEPPPHVIFLLATTDPQKLPVTVLSRCLQFHLKRMEEEQIVEHLTMILKEESIEFEHNALKPIGKGADGSMRDALSLLDQAIAYCADKLEYQAVLEMLGSIDQSYCYTLLQNVMTSDANGLIDTIQEMSQYSPDYFEVMSDWLWRLYTIAVAQATGNSSDDKIAELANDISSADLQLYYQLSLQAKKDLPYAPHPKQGFEMAMLRVLAFKPDNGTKNASGTQNQKKKITSNQEAITQSNPISQSNVDSVRSSLASSDKTTINVKNTSSPAAVKLNLAVENNLNPMADNSALQIKEPIAAPSIETTQKKTNASNVVELRAAINKIETSKPAKLTTKPIDSINAQQTDVKKVWYPDSKPLLLEEVTKDNWHLAVDQLPIQGNGLQLLINSLGSYKEGGLEVTYLSKVENFLTDNLRQSLLVDLSHFYKVENFKLDFKSAEELENTPKDRQLALHQKELKAIYQELDDNPCIALLQKEIGLVLDKESVKIK